MRKPRQLNIYMKNQAFDILLKANSLIRMKLAVIHQDMALEALFLFLFSFLTIKKVTGG